jgi:hypothetical protein
MRRFFAVLLPLALCACDQPPTKEISAAEAQIEEARQAGAERFVPDRWREAQGALATARAKVQAKDYRAALSAANDAVQRVADTLAKGDVLEAQKAAAELRAQAADLPAAFRDARALWEEEHPPKGRKPARR